jgi:hypothetical protein
VDEGIARERLDVETAGPAREGEPPSVIIRRR